MTQAMSETKVAPSTAENLSVAFAGESQANRKYLAFSQKAEQDGLPQIAKLFRAAAEAETLHALAHFKNAGMVGTTAENLRHAVEGETYEYTEMYPPMVVQAEKEGHKAVTMLRFAEKAEKVHAELYKLALAAAETGKDLPTQQLYLCPVCGHLEWGTPPTKCPICGAPASRFQSIE
jgi:rubrerythrin